MWDWLNSAWSNSNPSSDASQKSLRQGSLSGRSNSCGEGLASSAVSASEQLAKQDVGISDPTHSVRGTHIDVQGQFRPSNIPRAVDPSNMDESGPRADSIRSDLTRRTTYSLSHRKTSHPFDPRSDSIYPELTDSCPSYSPTQGSQWGTDENAEGREPSYVYMLHTRYESVDQPQHELDYDAEELIFPFEDNEELSIGQTATGTGTGAWGGPEIRTVWSIVLRPTEGPSTAGTIILEFRRNDRKSAYDISAFVDSPTQDHSKGRTRGNCARTVIPVHVPYNLATPTTNLEDFKSTLSECGGRPADEGTMSVQEAIRSAFPDTNPHWKSKARLTVLDAAEIFHTSLVRTGQAEQLRTDGATSSAHVL